jgi:hypothetical protein
MIRLADGYSGLRRECRVVHQTNDLSLGRDFYVFRNTLGQIIRLKAQQVMKLYLFLEENIALNMEEE